MVHASSGMRTLARTMAGGAILTTLVSAQAAEPAAKPKPRLGGTVVVALGLEPTSLNSTLGLGARYSTSVVVDQILASAYHDAGRGGRWVRDLLARDPKLTTSPFSLTYTIKKKTRWSDGVPVTASDFVFTWQVLVNRKFDIPDDIRAQYDTVTRAKILGPKTVRFWFSKRKLDWKELFAPVLPQHALVGEDFDQVWRDRIDNPKSGRPIASGPFVFENWSRGGRLTLARNAKYWGKKPYLAHLSFRFILPDFGAQVAALRAGEVDVIQPPVLLPGDLLKSPGIRVQTGSGFGWEHIDFQFGPKGNPALRSPFVRQAIAYGIDRRALTTSLYKELAPGLKTAQSAIFMPFQLGYRPHWRIWAYSPKKAVRLLRSHGCARGGDEIFTCGGRRLSFRFLSTAGSVLRERTFATLEAQLRRVGIDLVNAFGPRQLVIRTTLPQGDWDLALFSWLYGPGLVGMENIWECNGELNFAHYCNRTVTRLLGRASTELRLRRRVPLLSRADAVMAGDLATLPLFVHPGYVMYNSRIRNVVYSPIDVLWNAEHWWISGS